MDPLVLMIFVKLMILTVPAMIMGAMFFRRIRREDEERARLIQEGKLIEWPNQRRETSAAA